MRPSFSAVFPLLVALVATTSGCAAIEGIFKAGVWVGVLIVLLVVGLAVAATTMFRR
jgi:hypothetical protein